MTEPLHVVHWTRIEDSERAAQLLAREILTGVVDFASRSTGPYEIDKPGIGDQLRAYADRFDRVQAVFTKKGKS